MKPAQFAGLSVVALAVGAFAAAQAVSGMHRAELAYVAASHSASPPRLTADTGAILTASGQPVAEAALIRLVGDRAATAGLRVTITPLARNVTAIHLTLVAQGPEQAVVRFASSLEQGRPLARLAHWSIDGRGEGVRLTGELVAPWTVR